MRSRRFFKR
jgi:hypothetical protein